MGLWVQGLEAITFCQTKVDSHSVVRAQYPALAQVGRFTASILPQLCPYPSPQTLSRPIGEPSSIEILLRNLKRKPQHQAAVPLLCATTPRAQRAQREQRPRLPRAHESSADEAAFLSRAESQYSECVQFVQYNNRYESVCIYLYIYL